MLYGLRDCRHTAFYKFALDKSSLRTKAEEIYRSVKTTGTDIDKLMPPMSRFSNVNRTEKKQAVIEKLLSFFEWFFGIR